jgi:hypothetical protein
MWNPIHLADNEPPLFDARSDHRGMSCVVPVMVLKAKMSDTALALVFGTVSLALAFAAAPVMSPSPETVSLPSASKPSLTKYHNARLRQDRQS